MLGQKFFILLKTQYISLLCFMKYSFRHIPGYQSILVLENPEYQGFKPLRRMFKTFLPSDILSACLQCLSYLHADGFSMYNHATHPSHLMKPQMMLKFRLQQLRRRIKHKEGSSLHEHRTLVLKEIAEPQLRKN